MEVGRAQCIKPSSGSDGPFLTLRALLLGCVGALAGIFDGGGHDGGSLLRVGMSLMKEVERFCGGATYLAVNVMGKPGLPFLSLGEEQKSESRLSVGFDTGADLNSYMENLRPVILALEALFAIASALQRCGDKDDTNRAEVCDNFAKASCWILCMKNSSVKHLLESTLASIEGNWSESNKLLMKAIGQIPQSSEINTIVYILNVLMGHVAENPSMTPPADLAPDIKQLLSRCCILTDHQFVDSTVAEAPKSVGGLLELADELFVVKKFAEASVLLDRCEEIMTCNRRVAIEHCGMRNYRSELLYQRGRLFHAVKKNYQGAYTLYEASLSYCQYHVASLYQLTRLEAAKPPNHAEPGSIDLNISRFPTVLEHLSPAGAEGLKTLCLLRDAMATPKIGPGKVDSLVGCQIEESDLEIVRLKLEVLVKITREGYADKNTANEAARLICLLLRASVSFIPAQELSELLRSMHQEAGEAGAAAATQGDSENRDMAMGEEDLFGESVVSKPPETNVEELQVHELVFAVLRRRTVPMRWILLAAKFLTDSYNPECAKVWQIIRYESKLRRHSLGISKAELGTLTAIYVMQDHGALHSRLKKILSASASASSSSQIVDPKSREIVAMRLLHHIAKGELALARQIVERALSYSDEQVTISSGQNRTHWETFAVYTDFLVLTRIGNPFECMTIKLLDGIFKKDIKRRREDTTAVPMPNALRSRIQTLSAWMLLQQANLSYSQRSKLARGEGSPKIKKNYKSLYTEAKRLALQAVETCPSNWRAGLVMAEACKGLKDYANASKICTVVGEYVGSSDTMSKREKEYVENYLLKEMAYSLCAERPAPLANRGKLVKAVRLILENGIANTIFLTKLANSIRDAKLAHVVFNMIVDYIENVPIGQPRQREEDSHHNLSLDKLPLPLVAAIARVGNIACMESAKDSDKIKDPSFLGGLIADAELVAAAYRKVLSEQQKYSLDTASIAYTPHGSRALEYLVHANQPVIGPMPQAVVDGQDVDESQITQTMLDELPNIETLQQKLVEDMEALLERLRDIQPMVKHEFATACAVREERLRESAKILEDIESRGVNSKESVPFSLD